MAQNKHYFTPVGELSNADLETLSEEIREAYCLGGEEDFWTDDEAEERYYAMAREQNRRFRLAHPEYEPPALGEVTKMVLLGSLQSILIAKEIDSAYSCKIGDVVSVRKPLRFTSREGRA